MQQVGRPRLIIALTVAVLLLALGIGAAMLLERMHDTADSNARQNVQRVSRVAESTINRTFLAVDGTLAGLPEILKQFARDGEVAPAIASRTLRELNFQNFSFRDLVLLRPDGRPWAAALAASRGRALPLDPAALAEAARAGTVIITGPVRNPLTGEWALFFLRALEVPGPGPLIAAAEVPVSLLGTLLAPVAELPGIRISIERVDGRIMAGMPHDETRIGRILARDAAAIPDGRVVRVPGRFVDAPVLTAVRTLLYRDLVVVTSYEERAAYAGWVRDRGRLLGVTGIIGLLLVGMALVLILAIRQRELTDAETRRSRALLDNALEAMPDGFVMFDEEDRLVICNQRYKNMYEVSAPFIVTGAKFADIIRQGAARGQYPQAGDDLEAFVADITAWHRGNHPSMERLLPDGRWVMVTERRTPNGGTVGIRTDITALKQAMTQLAEARDAAAAATEAKSRFLAQMSHELRTPLNGVLGLAQALARDPALTGEQRQRARTLEDAGRHLVAVANDVLDLAKVEAGRLELRPQPTALQTLLEGCTTLVRPAAEEKGIHLSVSTDPSMPAVVRVDQTRLRQLLLNLLSNAVKFTPAGGRVTLTATPLRAELEDGRVPVRIEVRDTGPGVPEAQRRAVFADFVQLDRGNRAGGTGLGLAIAAGIATQMEGSIGCDANPEGRGAVFWVVLPMEPTLAPLPELPQTPEAEAPRGLHVLVADDVMANLAVARALLESAGHTVECVGDGAQALRAVQDSAQGRRFDAVLMDVMMPGMDGLEATRRIRALPAPLGRIPVLAVTASAFAEDIAACRNAGMDAHLAKPIERDALIAALERLARGQAPAAPAPAAQPSSGLSALPLLTRRAGQPLSIPGLSAEAAQRLAPGFLEEIADQTRALGATTAETLPDAVGAAHRLAGAAATLGATRLAAAAREFQAEARHLPAEAALALRDEVLAIAGDTAKALAAAIGSPAPTLSTAAA